MSFIDILMIVFPVVVVSILTWDRAIVGKMPILCAVSHAFHTIIVLCLRYTMQLVGCLISWFWYIDLKVIDWVVGTEYAPLTSCVSRNGKKVVVTSDPEFVKRALRMGRKSCIRDEVGPLKEIVSHIEEKSGELFSEDEWRMALDAARTTFDEKNIRGFIEKSAVFHKRYINGLMEVVSQGKREFHLYNFLCAASFDSMMHAVYGMDWRTIDDDDRHLFGRFAFLQAPHELLSAKTLRHYLIDGPGCDMFKLDSPDATEALKKIGYTVINRLQSERESIPCNGTCPFLKNYINRPQYYKNRDDDMGATMSTLIVLAGTDAMAFALYVTLYLLARNPDKQTIMRHEVTRVLADKKESTFEDLKELKYVEAVILESLRLFPPKGTLTRYATKSNVCGISLEDGDLIEINIRKMNSTHENFTNPLDFLPERFTDPRIRRERKHQNLLTFGSDPCLGKDFAMNIMKHFLASFVLSLKVERVARTPTLFCLPENRVTSDHFSRRESFDKNPLHIGLSLTNPDGAEC